MHALHSAAPLPVSGIPLEGATTSYTEWLLLAEQLALRTVQQLCAGPCSPAEGADDEPHRAVARDLRKGVVLLQQVIQRLGLLLPRFGQLCKWQQDASRACGTARGSSLSY